MVVKLSRRQRLILAALAKQTVWPQRTTTGWIGEAEHQDWVPQTRKVLVQLSVLGLVEDLTIDHLAQVGDRITMAPAQRFRITDAGRKALRDK